MPTITEPYASLGRSRAEQLIAQYETGFTVHPLSYQGISLTKSQVRQWLFLLAWWDSATAQRFVGSGLSRGQLNVFEDALLMPIYERLWTDTEYPDGDEVFDATREAMRTAWNEGVPTEKSHSLALVVGLKSMGITLADTPDYNGCSPHVSEA